MRKNIHVQLNALKNSLNLCKNQVRKNIHVQLNALKNSKKCVKNQVRKNIHVHVQPNQLQIYKCSLV